MPQNNFSLPSIDALTAALTAAGLVSFLSQPLWIHGPSVLQAFSAGKIDINARRLDAQRENAAMRQEKSASAAVEESSRPSHPNALQLLAVAPDNVVAIQPVNGIIYSGVDAFEEMYYWLFNLDRLHHTVARVSSDPTIKTLVLKMYTPGGSVYGLNAAATALLGLAAARPDVTVVSYAQTLCASAGMYLAAATQEIHAAPGAAVGSIGTIASLTDTSGFWEKLGVTTEYYTADSKLKDMGGRKIKPEHREHMESVVGQYSAEFKGWMSERRGLAAESMHGQCWEARLAPDGMCDSAFFPTFEQFLAAGLL